MANITAGIKCTPLYGAGSESGPFYLKSLAFYEGGLVGIDPADGKLDKMESGKPTLICAGRMKCDVDNSGAAGLTGEVVPGVYELTFDSVTDADLFALAFALDDQSARTSNNGGARPALGTIVKVVSSTKALVKLGGAIDAKTAAIYNALLSPQATIPIPLGGAIDIATGAVLAVFAGGASTTPGTQFTDSKTSGIRWNNDAAPGAIAVNVAMPQDLDADAPVVFHALVSKTGATLADATKLTVGAFEHIPGALHDADADFGGDTTAVTGDAAAKTLTEVTLTFTAANIHAAPSSLCLTIKPKAGTLGTDDFILHSAWLEYQPKLLKI